MSSQRDKEFTIPIWDEHDGKFMSSAAGTWMIRNVATSPRLLVVDDDPKFRKFAVQGLCESGFEVRTASGVADATEILKQQSVDVVLLDVMMPGADGHELLRTLRQSGRDVPVIFVTARGATSERIEGLRLGADDYIVKPFTFAELVARIEAVLRRHSSLPQLRCGTMSIDLARRVVVCAGREVAVSLKELDLLSALVRARGAVVTKAALLAEVWGIHHDPETNLVEVHVGRVRRKLRLPGCPRVETVRGLGYRLVLDS